MECRFCNPTVKKLSREFPPFPISASCKHVTDICIQCVIKHVEKNRVCPYPDCLTEIHPDSQNILIIKQISENLFTEYETFYTAETPVQTAKGYIYVSTLIGNRKLFMFRENKEIFELKHEIQEAFSVEIKLQKLFHKGQCLNNTDSKGVRCILADYNVCAGDQIYLIKLLCELPSKILKITLDVDWGYPQSQEKWLFGLITWTRHHRDYLDASCFAFEDNSDEYFVVNIQNKEQPGIKHQSEFLDRKRKRGHHKMSVSLQDLKDTVTHLFFTLSARGEGRTVDHYIAPELNIYESDSTNSENLCETSLAGCSDQSVIICSVYRSEDSVWRISDVRKSCKGNINDTSHLVSEMKLLKNKIK